MWQTASANRRGAMILIVMCHPMRTKARIASVKSYKIYVSLSEGWIVIFACILSLAVMVPVKPRP